MKIFNSIPEQSLRVLEAILKTIEEGNVLTNAGNYLLASILDEQNEQTAELHKQTALLVQIADALTSPPTLTSSEPIILGEKMANNTYVMNVGQSQPGVISPLLADGTTASGGVVSNVVITFTDPSATFAVGADGVTITFTGVAASTGAVSGSVAFTVTDTDSAVSQWTDPITVTINAVVPPAQLTQSAPIVVGVATP